MGTWLAMAIKGFQTNGILATMFPCAALGMNLVVSVFRRRTLLSPVSIFVREPNGATDYVTALQLQRSQFFL